MEVTRHVIYLCHFVELAKMHEILVTPSSICFKRARMADVYPAAAFTVARLEASHLRCFTSSGTVGREQRAPLRHF